MYVQPEALSLVRKASTISSHSANRGPTFSPSQGFDHPCLFLPADPDHRVLHNAHNSWVWLCPCLVGAFALLSARGVMFICGFTFLPGSVEDGICLGHTKCLAWWSRGQEGRDYGLRVSLLALSDSALQPQHHWQTSDFGCWIQACVAFCLVLWTPLGRHMGAPVPPFESDFQYATSPSSPRKDLSTGK